VVDSNNGSNNFVRKWLPVIGFVSFFFIAIAYQYYLTLPRKSSENLIYLDDVTISFDNILAFQDEISTQSQNESIWRLSLAHLDNDTFHSAPSSLAMECKYFEDYQVGAVVPNVSVPSTWNEVNITWHLMLSKKVWSKDNVNQQFDIYMKEDGDSVSRLYCGLRIADNQPQVDVGIVYFGDDPPNSYHFRQDVEIGYNEWHKLTFLLNKPTLLIYYDNELVSSSSVHPDYLSDGIVFRWRTYHLDSW